MDEAAPPFPWSLAFAGLLLAGLGVAGFARRGWLNATARWGGGVALSGAEARRVPGALVVAGALWLFGCWGFGWPFAHGQRPYWVVIGTTLGLPLAALLTVGIPLYLLVVRRLRT